MSRQIRLFGLNAQDANYFQLLLKFVENSLDDTWAMVDGTVAAAGSPIAIVVDVDRPEGLAFWRANFNTHEMLVAFSKKPNFDSTWLLANPLRTRGCNSISDVLNQLSQKFSAHYSLQTREAANTDSVQVTRSIATPLSTLPMPIREAAAMTKWTENAGNASTFSEALVRVLQSRQTVKILLNGRVHLYIDSQGQQYFQPVTVFQLDDLLESAEKVDVSVRGFLDRAGLLEEIAQQNVLTKPLSNLIWRTHIAADPRPHGWNIHDGLLLSRWPDFSKLPIKNNHLRLASIFSRHRQSFAMACRVHNLDADGTMRFLNACHALGLLTAEPIKEATPERTPNVVRSERVGLIQSMMRRIALISR